MKRMSGLEGPLKVLQSASDLDQILLRRGRTDLTLWRPILLKLNFCHGPVDHPNKCANLQVWRQADSNRVTIQGEDLGNYVNQRLKQNLNQQNLISVDLNLILTTVTLRANKREQTADIFHLPIFSINHVDKFNGKSQVSLHSS